MEADAEGLVKVISTGNRKISAIQINQQLIAEGDNEKLEDLCLLAVNKALEKAEKLAETEMQSIAKGMLPTFM